MLNVVGRPVIGDAEAIQVPQEHDAGTRRDESTVEAELDGSPAVILQNDRFCATVCLHGLVCLQSVNLLNYNRVRQITCAGHHTL